MGSHPERILCIKEEELFKDGKWNGFKSEDLDRYKELILSKAEFRPRDELENDTSYKQIIAQVILKYKDKYFLHKQVNRSEQRLNSLCPLPLGGHIEEFDLNKDNDIIETALLREMHEEAEVNAQVLKQDLLGLVYLEDENPVNHVHVGLVYVFEIDNDDVHVKEEGLENIGFVSLDYLKTNQEKLTYWSRIIIYHL